MIPPFENYEIDEENFYAEKQPWLLGSIWDLPDNEENLIVSHTNFTNPTLWGTQNKNQNEGGDADSVGVSVENQNDRGSMMNSRRTPEPDKGAYISFI